jgi:hypothetical protein
LERSSTTLIFGLALGAGWAVGAKGRITKLGGF